jgi:GlcNAc-P-P-Und epimerase
MKICVIGGSGFIGTHLVRQLLASGQDVTIFDKVQSATFPGICQIGDVRNFAAVDDALVGKDVVINLAAEHRDDVRPESLYHDVNVGGAKNICEAARVNDVRRIIFTSSVAIYGLNAGCPSEASEPRPFNAYGETKWQAELLFRSWANQDARRSLVVIRPVVVFGEGNRGNVYNLLRQIQAQRFVMVGDGQNKKSMAYVTNLVDFIESVLGDEPGIETYNYLDFPDMTTSELVSSARRAFGMTHNPVAVPYWLGLIAGHALDVLARATGRKFPITAIRVRKFCADTAVSGQKLRARNFQARYSLSEGLERTIRTEFLDRDQTRIGG